MLVTDSKSERALVLSQLQVLTEPILNMFQTPEQACSRQCQTTCVRRAAAVALELLVLGELADFGHLTGASPGTAYALSLAAISGSCLGTSCISSNQFDSYMTPAWHETIADPAAGRREFCRLPSCGLGRRRSSGAQCPRLPRAHRYSAGADPAALHWRHMFG